MDIGRDLKFNNYPFQQLEKNEITDLLFITVFNITFKKNNGSPSIVICKIK